MRPAIERHVIENPLSAWEKFAHMVRSNDSFLALLLGAWLATFSIFLMDNFRAASVQLAAWNVVEFEMQNNAHGIFTELPAIDRLAGAQSLYRTGQLVVPEPFFNRGDDLVLNKALIDLFGKDAAPFLTYYAEIRIFNRQREAFLDFMNTGPMIKPRSDFYNRVQAFYISFRDQMQKIAAVYPEAKVIADRNWARSSRNSTLKSAAFYGMLIGSVFVSILYLFVRRTGGPRDMRHL